MENANQVPDPVALPRVACPDCGRIVVTFVARRGQFAGEHFYKCRNHNPGRDGCDFHRWQEAYAEHLASLGPAAPPLAQINPDENEIGGANQGGHLQAADGEAGNQGGGSDGSQMSAAGGAGGSVLDAAASGAGGYVLGAAVVGRRPATVALDPASINLVVSVGNMVICIAILVLVAASSMMRVFD
ncbi:uncharacterized protein LOC119346854 [Triticum dicoccoides]|uniref:uncharacterized protein LOC119346854 n=1 Tax=Triticum dicoccoides TaxID=85692 RepID=UPI001890AAC3|nr:uncharacterized protein LOC119346854 [Triticum dicoccoides]